MIDETLLKLIRCPLDGQPLSLLDDRLTAELNRLVEQQALRDRVDALVDEPLQSALVTADGTRAYPVREGIPTLIPSESIPLPAELRPPSDPGSADPVSDQPL